MPPPKPIEKIDWEREADDADKYDSGGTCVVLASMEEEKVLVHGMNGRSLPRKKEELLHRMKKVEGREYEVSSRLVE